MKSFTIAVLLLLSSFAQAQDKPVNGYSGAPWQKPENGIQVENQLYGSGDPTPGVDIVGTSTAVPVADGAYHVPSYMPGFPTSARIDPRVVQVPCVRTPGGTAVCQGFNVNTQTTGRGEYLLVQPVIAAPKAEVQVAPVVTPLPVIKGKVKG